jgi:hypothetical protein
MTIFPKSRRKVILWLVLPLALLASGIGAAVPLLVSGLPDPAVANREELLRWLVARDLSQQSPETCLVLVRRLEEEFRDGVDWAALDGQLTEPQREQLWKNIPLLFGPWLSDKAAIYARLSNRERPKFMDEIFKTLVAWQGADRLQTKPTSDAPSATPRSLLAVFSDQVEATKRNAEPSERERISQFIWALQIRTLMR